MYETIRYGVEDGVARITLARPDKRNAMNLTVFDELGRAAQAAVEDPSVRAVLVRGEGPSFSAGIDLSVFVELAGQDRPAFERLIRTAQRPFWTLAAADTPSVAAVRGHALGAGFQLALACDLRVAAEDVRFGMLELRFGILPDLGGNHRLASLVGPARAKELTWTGRLVEADEALRLGLANRVAPADRLDEEAETLARQLAGAPPLPVAAVKSIVDRAASSGLEASMDRERRAQIECLMSDDAREAVAAHFDKRPARFAGR
ncbi:MAG: enoyl-CoA hydratase/isomerase family protein [Actinobacteria bacterium]|nr:enoyl-CoA hydratase/isomerase family protein [Actinomycetota bacterium]